MRNQSGASRCTACQGQGWVKFHQNGNAQLCPFCEGAGQIQPTPARIPVWYVLGPVTINANATLNQSIEIDTTADFEWIWNVSSQTSSSLNIGMLDGSTGRQIIQPQPNISSNIGVLPIGLFAGTAQLPFPLVEPYIIARGSNVQFLLTDTSGSNNTLTLALVGYKLIPQQAPMQGSSGMIGQQRQQ
jgi:hypothetical protein